MNFIMSNSKSCFKKKPTRLCSSEQEKYRTIIQQYNTFKFSKKRSICVQYRIDKLAEAGLDIWATELTVDEADDVKKADALGNLLTMYFSHPSVGGVILWHFWNESLWHPNENLFDGPDIKVKFHTRLIICHACEKSELMVWSPKILSRKDDETFFMSFNVVWSVTAL